MRSISTAWSEWKHDLLLDIEMDVCHKGRSLFVAWLTSLPYHMVPCRVIQAARDLACRVRGHDYAGGDESYVNPDGAAEYFVCNRCGRGHEHIYF